MPLRITIIGKGLAGSWLGYELVQHGCSVRFFDVPDRNRASNVAAGVINPITGSRPQLQWRADEIIPYSLNAYRQLEERTGVSLLHSSTIRRIFASEKDRQFWMTAVDRGLKAPWARIEPGIVNSVPAVLGGVEYDGYVVDAQASLTALESVTPAECNAEEVDAYTPADNELVVWCTGWRASKSTLWNWLPFQPVKGDILDVVHTAEPLTAIYTQGIGVVPRQHSPNEPNVQYLRVGSTYVWDFDDTQPDREAGENLLTAAEKLLNRRLTVVDHRAAVRPALQNKRPVIGKHPRYARHYIVNGLGLKGILWAPWTAKQCANLILNNIAVDPEISTMRWWRE